MKGKVLLIIYIRTQNTAGRGIGKLVLEFRFEPAGHLQAGAMRHCYFADTKFFQCFHFGFSQHQAQGTTLALLVPPIGILAAWTYYRQGDVDFHAALFICIGFLIGSFAGAKLATNISNIVLERTFGIELLLISLKMISAK